MRRSGTRSSGRRLELVEERDRRSGLESLREAVALMAGNNGQEGYSLAWQAASCSALDKDSIGTVA